MSQRIALRLQYLGKDFCGWQRQLNGISVQEVIEEAISAVTAQTTTIHGAGRTDTGVHASWQVAHFDTDSPIPPDRWAKVLNTRLPPTISIVESVRVEDGWHAQFTALWRRYRYVIYTGACPSVFLRPFSWHYYYQKLHCQAMHEALQPLLGEHDFGAFQRAGSKRRHGRLTVHFAKCWQEGELILMEMQASGFLYGMIRLLMGQLVRVGSGELARAEFTRIWQSGERSSVRYAAPPQGLCLIGVGYPHDPFQHGCATEDDEHEQQFPPLGVLQI
jgi:tRNA pseudouridine38-40 synthase